MTEYLHLREKSKPVEIPHGESIELFENATLLGTGQIDIPSRRIMLPGIANPATMKTWLPSIRRFDTRWFKNYDQEVVARLAVESPHEPGLTFSDLGRDVYAMRNMYPFGSNLSDENGNPLEFAALSISLDFDNGSVLGEEELDAMLERFEKKSSKKQPRHSNVSQLRLDLYPDSIEDYYERLKRHLLVVHAGDAVAVAPYNIEDHIMSQSLDSFRYDQFGIVGSEGTYYEKLTPGAPDLLDFVGGSLLVPLDIDVLRTIKIEILPANSGVKKIS